MSAPKGNQYAKSENPRAKRLNIPLTESELELITQLAEAESITMSEFARRKIFGEANIQK